MANYYINPHDGSDENNGTTAELAFKSLVYAATQVAPGDALIFVGGDYGPLGVNLDAGQVPQWDGDEFVEMYAVDNAFQNPLPNLTNWSFLSLNLQSGANVIALPEIPSGYKLWAIECVLHNPTTGSITNNGAILTRSAQEYNLTLATAIGAGAQVQICFALSPSDTLTINASAGGLVLWCRAYLVPTSDKVKPLTVVIGTGDNTIYTCPAGKKAFLLPNIPMSIISTVVGFRITNNSDGSRNYVGYIVPSGDSPGTANRFFGMASVGIGSFANRTIGAVLNAGDSLVVNSDGAGNQLFIGTIYEVDA